MFNVVLYVGTFVLRSRIPVWFGVILEDRRGGLLEFSEIA